MALSDKQIYRLAMWALYIGIGVYVFINPIPFKETVVSSLLVFFSIMFGALITAFGLIGSVTGTVDKKDKIILDTYRTTFMIKMLGTTASMYCVLFAVISLTCLFQFPELPKIQNIASIFTLWAILASLTTPYSMYQTFKEYYEYTQEIRKVSTRDPRDERVTQLLEDIKVAIENNKRTEN